MNTAKLIVTGAAALAISVVAMEEDFTIAQPSTMYEVDEDHDGRADRMLMLEQSDSLA